MRKKLTIRSERLRNLTDAERAAIIGGVNVGTGDNTSTSTDSFQVCIPDPPPRAR